MPNEPILKVAVPVPLRALFDYYPPQNADAASLMPGVRVRVPFGKGKRIGVIVSVCDESEFDNLKRVLEVLDEAPVLGVTELALMNWCARYYQHPVGEVIAAALPVNLRKGKPYSLERSLIWSISDEGRLQLPQLTKRSARQKEVLELLTQEVLPDEVLAQRFAGCRSVLNRLHGKGWVVCEERAGEACSPQIIVDPQTQFWTRRFERR